MGAEAENTLHTPDLRITLRLSEWSWKSGPRGTPQSFFFSSELSTTKALDVLTRLQIHLPKQRCTLASANRQEARLCSAIFTFSQSKSLRHGFIQCIKNVEIESYVYSERLLNVVNMSVREFLQC